MNFNNDDDRQEALKLVTAKAAVDRAYRTRLLTDPNRAIAEVIGRPVPASLTIRFIEKDPDVDILVVLPDLLDEVAELSEEDLDAVAGGTDWCSASCSTTEG